MSDRTEEQLDRLLDKVEELADASAKCSELTALCAQRLDSLHCQAAKVEGAIYGPQGIQVMMHKMDQRVGILEKIVWGVTMAIIVGFVGTAITLMTRAGG